MIGLDTNVLLRFLMRDDARQSSRAAALIRDAFTNAEDILVSDVVLVEAVWVLQSVHDSTRDEVLFALRSLLDNVVFSFESRDAVEQAIDSFERTRADFADCLIVSKNRASGCRATHTFDKGLRAVAGATLL